MEALTGSSCAGHVLEDLHRRNCFIGRLAGTGGYRLHPLFREFLLARQAATYTPEQLATVRCRTAELLEQAGAIEDALEAWRRVPDWDAVARLVRRHAGGWAEQSRMQTLGQWLTLLPPAIVDGEPWLLYWRGVCLTPVAPADARKDLERAYDGFDRADDADGMYLAWSSIVTTLFVQWSDFSAADRWIDVFAALRARHPSPSPAIEPRVTCAVVCVLSHRHLGHPWMEEWLARADALAGSECDPRHPPPIDLQMVVYLQHAWTGRFDLALAPLLRIAAAAADPGSSPALRIAARNLLAIHAWTVGDPASADEYVSDALDLASRHGLTYWTHQLNGQGAAAALVRGDLARAREYLARMQAHVEERAEGPLFESHVHWIASALASEVGDAVAAARQADIGLRLAEEARFTFGAACLLVTAANAAFLEGARARAAAHLAALGALATRGRSRLLECYARVTEAAWAFGNDGSGPGLEPVRAALAASREVGGAAVPGVPRERQAALFAEALDQGIEIEHARAQIRRLGLAPPRDGRGSELWPFALRIYTFGRVSIVRDGAPLRFAAKAQRRPLEFLSVLVALGGRAVPEAAVSDALWPDTDADLARANLKATLHRARKLVGIDAIVLEGGKLSLDAEHCWVDAWVVERALNAVLEAREDVQALSLLDTMRQAWRLCHAPFLVNDDHAWALRPRERLSSKLVSATSLLAQRLERDGRPDEGVAALEKTIRVVPAETLFQQLMRVLLAQGRAGLALATYDFCARALEHTNGRRPSRETEALRERARQLAG
jgi:DNA-binding SARP family transcriptional activator